VPRRRRALLGRLRPDRDGQGRDPPDPRHRLGFGARSGRQRTPQRARRDHRAPRPHGLARGFAGTRSPRAGAPRGATLVHRCRRPPFQAILTDQSGEIADVERRHRARARVEDHIRNDKDTGLRNTPSDFEHNRGWLALVLIAHDLICWTQRLLLTGELVKAEPKRLRYRLLHVAGRLSFHARGARLRLQASWP
jgi:hypothetical protein